VRYTLEFRSAHAEPGSVISFLRRALRSTHSTDRSAAENGTGPLDVLVEVTPRTFDPVLYRLANPDIAEAGADPAAHFKAFGRAEGRLQVNPALLDPASAYRREKFARFASLLDDSYPCTAFPAMAGTALTLKDYLAESANIDFAPFIAEIEAHPGRTYLDLGCGLRRRVYRNCLYLEVYPSVAADVIVEPTCSYPIRDGAFDGIGCFAVLEHTRQPWRVAREIHRMLKPGGRIWIDWPFLQPVHGYPSHYFNATREGLSSIFEDLGFRVESAETRPDQGPEQTLAWILRALADRLPLAERTRFEALTVGELLREPPQGPLWSDLLGELDDSTRSMLACGNCLIATKAP
jgi:SAM-dependent methyltransferase